NDANYGASPADGTPVRVANDHTAPVEIANEVLFGERAPVRAASLNEAIEAGTILRPGARGPEVAELQRRLGAIGFRAPETSSYDADTVAAVRAFQRAYRIGADGNFGATSLEYMRAGEAVTEPGRRGVGVSWNDGVRGERLELLYINGKPVTVEAANALRPMFVNAARAPRPVRLEIVSGYRTYEEQRELRADYLAGRGNLAAPAGHSNHHSGIAVDLNTSDPGVYTWLRNNARHYGFLRTVPSERWHWEFRPDLVR
ncbi:D-alanyl-D-alanine carboxypeptidase family protein, partial [Myxococcota bacterium]|nr:D-alanyl-D-alanine carboxypeptidase family protein [Myxococcota bacterium]